MTVAVDLRTGKVIGQVTAERVLPNGEPCGYTLLTKDGYRDVHAASVRVEKV